MRTPTVAGAPRAPLLRVMGTLGLAAGIVNITIGGGIFRLPANVAGSLGAAAPLAYLVFTFWSIVNVCGVALGARLNAIATAAKLGPLLVVAIGGAFFVDPDNLRIDVMPASADIARTSLILIFAFAGIEVALVPSGEVKDTARTVPRAIALAMVTITLLYVTLQVVAQGSLGSGLAGATVAPLADAAGASLGPWGRSLLLAGATISVFGYLGGVTLTMPRMLFALAEDGFLPRALAAVHERYRSPHVAIGVQSTVALALAVTGTFESLAVFANVSALALYFGCALAAWRLGAGGERAGSLSWGATVPWLACGVIAWLLTGLTRAEWIGFGACVAVASLVYVSARWRSHSP